MSYFGSASPSLKSRFHKIALLVPGTNTNETLNSECFCSNYVNSLSAKLPDSDCNLACAGNSSQVCGGPLRLTVYNVKTQQQKDEEKKSAGVKRVVQAGSLGLGTAMAMVFWLA